MASELSDERASVYGVVARAIAHARASTPVPEACASQFRRALESAFALGRRSGAHDVLDPIARLDEVEDEDDVARIVDVVLAEVAVMSRSRRSDALDALGVGLHGALVDEIVARVSPSSSLAYVGHLDLGGLAEIDLVGAHKPLGYLPLSVVAALGLNVEELCRRATAQGNDVAVLLPGKTWERSGVVLVWDEQALDGHLAAASTTLSVAGWPVSAAGFAVETMRRYAPDAQTHALIATAFADPRPELRRADYAALRLEHAWWARCMGGRSFDLLDPEERSAMRASVGLDDLATDRIASGGHPYVAPTAVRPASVARLPSVPSTCPRGRADLT